MATMLRSKRATRWARSLDATKSATPAAPRIGAQLREPGPPEPRRSTRAGCQRVPPPVRGNRALDSCKPLLGGARCASHCRTRRIGTVLQVSPVRNPLTVSVPHQKRTSRSARPYLSRRSLWTSGSDPGSRDARYRCSAPSRLMVTIGSSLRCWIQAASDQPWCSQECPGASTIQSRVMLVVPSPVFLCRITTSLPTSIMAK